MATIDTYFDLAREAAKTTDPSTGSALSRGWQTQKWEWASFFGDGFQGGVFEHADEIVVGFGGTGAGGTGSTASQVSGDIRIGVNVIPNMAGSANALVTWAKARPGGKPVSIVGHSLGGALAQVVGNWSGCPFIAFNGPGMKSHLKASAFNIFKPRQMFRSITSANTDTTIGICFTSKGDAIAEFGYHVGLEIELPSNPSNGAMERHRLLPGVYYGLGQKQFPQEDAAAAPPELALKAGSSVAAAKPFRPARVSSPVTTSNRRSHPWVSRISG